MANSKCICSVAGCGKPIKGRSLCAYHYQRLRRTGSVEPHIPQAQWLFDHKHHKGDNCLLWPFSKNAGGYGSVTYRNVRQSASRLMCVLAHGEPQGAKDTRHKCRNRLCCNPRHLEWGTRTENMNDKRRDGTSRCGEDNPNSILTESKVKRILKLSQAVSQKRLAKDFGVSQRAIFDIIHGRKWAHINRNDVAER